MRARVVHLGDPPAEAFALRFNTLKRLGGAGVRMAIGRTITRIVDGKPKYDFEPAHKWANGAAPDTAEECGRLAQRFPTCDRIAIVAGPCRAVADDEEIVGLDVDVNHGDGADGFKSLRAILDELGIEMLPNSPRWRTPKGGLHLIFRVERGVVLQPRPAPGVEIKQRNSLMTCPPTARPDGAYTWLKGCAPWEI